jgi:hypothetical protein
VGRLHCIDPSSALAVARQALADQPNVQFRQVTVVASGLPPNSQDFGYSFGMLHHVPNNAAAILSCTELLKPGVPLLLYLYYAFDNSPACSAASGAPPMPPACCQHAPSNSSPT